MKFTTNDTVKIKTVIFPCPKVEVKYHHPDLTRIMEYSKGDWIDLRSAEEVTLKEGEFKIISLGVSMKAPDGFEIWLAPRSSTFKKFGIIETNGFGIIDNSYCGNNDIIGMPVYATRDTHIPFDERIAQFRLMPTMEYMCGIINFNEVDNLQSEDRGGFGSSNF